MTQKYSRMTGELLGNASGIQIEFGIWQTVCKEKNHNAPCSWFFAWLCV